MPSRKRLTVFEDHEATVKVDNFLSTFFTFDKVDVGLVAQEFPVDAYAEDFMQSIVFQQNVEDDFVAW